MQTMGKEEPSTIPAKPNEVKPVSYLLEDIAHLSYQT